MADKMRDGGGITPADWKYQGDYAKLLPTQGPPLPPEWWLRQQGRDYGSMDPTMPVMNPAPKKRTFLEALRSALGQ